MRRSGLDANGELKLSAELFAFCWVELGDSNDLFNSVALAFVDVLKKIRNGFRPRLKDNYDSEISLFHSSIQRPGILAYMRCIVCLF